MRVCVKRRSVAAMAGAIPIACAIAFGGAGVLLGTAGADEGQLDGGCPSVTSTSAPAETQTSETQTSDTEVTEPAECEPSSDEPAPDEPAPSASTEVTSADPVTSDATTSDATTPPATTTAPVTTSSDPARTAHTTTPPATTTPADADTGPPATQTPETQTQTPEKAKESSTSEDRPSELAGAQRRPPGTASVPATATAPRIDLGLDATVPAVSQHVPGFGLLSDDSVLSPAKDSPGSAEALPPPDSAGIRPPAAAALCALALSFGLLARRWAMRTRRS